uniref:Putative ribonuclease H-like domain-containing protein n=1 Tax=Tanacetum cinerariifolium TaxID=118510 RepID=A0A6L2LWZ3_TANCI|nr:putative ribonuclease H-like domain-containing protein [Tanacetum cinerariifolium]
MSTRSSARNLFLPLDNPELTIRRRSRSDPTLLNNSKMAAEGPGDLPVPDLRTMEELCQPSLNGRGGPIAPIAIQATNFGLKNDMIQQLRNEITNFRQRPDESLFEAWERYKLSIDRCPNHNMLPVTQIDTFYNGLTLRHRDTINVVAGGTFMKRHPEECYDLIENMTAHHNDWDTSVQQSESSSSITSFSDTEFAALKAKMAEINKNLLRVLQVYKVVKALYGLHQAPRAWYATLSTFLVQSGYIRGLIDKTLFIKKDKKDIMLVQVYVDDIIFGSTKKSWCDEFEALMKNRFQMSSMGELTIFFGLQVKQKEEGIFISQDKYVAGILKKFDFLSVKTASTPIEIKKPLVKDEEDADVDVHLYRSMIGSLMYLTASRPDIMFQVTPKTSHLQVGKRIFRDAYEKKLIQVLKIHTDDNVADLYNKAFDVSRLGKRMQFGLVLEDLNGKVSAVRHKVCAVCYRYYC